MLLAVIAVALFIPPTITAVPPRSVQIQQMPDTSPPTQAIAIQRMPIQPITQCEVDFLSQNISGFTVRRVPRVESRGIALLDRKPGISDVKAKKAIERFLKNNKDWTSVPVIRSGGVEQIPTNNFVVKFKPGVTSKQAEEIFTAHGVEIVERPSEYSPSRYILRMPNVPAAKVLDLTNTLSTLSTVEFAQPDYILLFKRQ